MAAYLYYDLEAQTYMIEIVQPGYRVIKPARKLAGWLRLAGCSMFEAPYFPSQILRKQLEAGQRKVEL